MGGLSLWDIESGLLQLLEAREEAETPEAAAAVDEALGDYMAREVEKVDGIRAMLKHCEMMAMAARQEAEVQLARARIAEARRDRIKACAQAVMEAMGRDRLEGRTGRLLVKGNGGNEPLEIFDAAQVPEECCKYVGWIGGTLWAMIKAELPRIYARTTDRLAAELKLERTVDNGLTRLAIAREGGVPGAKLGDRGRHLEVK